MLWSELSLQNPEIAIFDAKKCLNILSALFGPKNITFGNIIIQRYRTYHPVYSCAECPSWEMSSVCISSSTMELPYDRYLRGQRSVHCPMEVSSFVILCLGRKYLSVVWRYPPFGKVRCSEVSFSGGSIVL